MLLIRCAATLALWLACACGFAQSLQPVPTLSGHVIDQTSTLNAEQLQGLESKLVAFESAHGAQIVVLLVPTTAPEDISSYANRVGDTWKVGRKDVGDGLILVVAKNDHKLRIEVAKSLEGAVPDLAAKRVIDDSIAPLFKTGDFAGGLDKGVGHIMALVESEGLPEPSRASGDYSASDRSFADFEWADLLVFLFIGVMVLGSIVRQVFGTKFGSLLTGGVVGAVVWTATASLALAGVAALVALAFVVISASSRRSTASSGWSNMGSGGGWSSGGGSDSGGGFSSGGGGNFGGGGASGGW
jgi:uncharacterized protein